MNLLSTQRSRQVWWISLVGVFCFAITPSPQTLDTLQQHVQAANAAEPGVEQMTSVVTAEAERVDVAAAAQGFDIIDLQRPSLLGGWRITWTSVPGRTYRLQRWATDELGLIGNPAWIDIETVRANANMAFADDPTAIVARKRFYRVALLEDTGGDLTPPEVSPIETRLTTVDGKPAAEVKITVADSAGVTTVEILNGSQVIGVAQRGPNDEWTFILPLEVSQLGARFLIARATDASGNVVHSSISPLGLVDPDRFAPLGANGLPVEGGTVQAVAPGQWGPVEYRPGGRNLLGQGPGFFIRFPNGIRIIRQGEEQLLEFTDAVAGFGPAYPLQLTEPLVKTGGATKQLRVGAVNLINVLEIFDAIRLRESA